MGHISRVRGPGRIYFGGMLARAGAHITLIGRPIHVDVWARDGLGIPTPANQSLLALVKLRAAQVDRPPTARS